MDSPLLVLVDSEDEALHATEFEANIHPYKGDAVVSCLQGSSHLGIVLNESAMAQTVEWIREKV